MLLVVIRVFSWHPFRGISLEIHSHFTGNRQSLRSYSSEAVRLRVRSLNEAVRLWVRSLNMGRAMPRT